MNPVSLVFLLALIVLFYYACLINTGADPAPADAHGHGHASHSDHAADDDADQHSHGSHSDHDTQH